MPLGTPVGEARGAATPDLSTDGLAFRRGCTPGKALLLRVDLARPSFRKGRHFSGRDRLVKCATRAVPFGAPARQYSGELHPRRT